VFAKKAKDVPSNYVDLAPTDEADEHGIYADALMVATNNPNVSDASTACCAC
jgi:hypothetical protein